MGPCRPETTLMLVGTDNHLHKIEDVLTNTSSHYKETYISFQKTNNYECKTIYRINY